MKKYYIIGSIFLLIVIFFSYKSFLPKSSNTLGFKEEQNLDLNNLASSSLPATPDFANKIAIKGDPPSDYIKYVNEKYSFYFYHSTMAKVTEYDQGQGAMIVTLENVKKVRGMQIFIVPYWEKTISEARFKKDIPSGIRTNVESTLVDGVEAVTFNSVDENLGATREVWFIRGGYLYEVTTFQGVGEWFIPKMQTWGFL